MTNTQGFALNLIDDDTASLSSRLTLTNKQLPPLEPGQVLIKMLASPINPSDLIYLLGKYGVESADQNFAGFEGCGIVIQANAGLYGKWLTGKRVAVAAEPGIDGLWAQYAITKANYCLPIRDGISNEQAATIIVNPLTSVCLVERAKTLGSKAIVLNAAASQVGKGVIRYAKMQGIKTIALVRSQANINPLVKLGADDVLLSTSENFASNLKNACQRHQAKILLDAVTEYDTATTLKGMPSGSTAIVYGRLAENKNPLGGYFSVADVIFRNIKIEGFWLATYMRKTSPLKIMSLSKKVQKLFAQGVFKTDIKAAVGFNEFLPALEYYASNKSEGKVILLPWLDTPTS